MRAAEVATESRRPERDPDAVGAWQVLDHQLPFPAAHAALLPTGKVLLFPGGRTHGGAKRAPTACLWDCHAGSLRTWNLPVDFSLGAQCFLPDGRLLVVGGIKEHTAIRLKETYLFDAATEEFLKVIDMPERGPCPTLIELGGGGVLAVGGSGKSRIQAYGKASGWTEVSHAEMDWPLYPQLTLLAGGSIFFSGQHFGGGALMNPGILNSSGDFAELPHAAVPPNPVFGFREQGATVALPPVQDQKVLVLGGSPSRSDVHIMDFSGADPVLRSAAPMPLPRANFGTVILPDHTILTCGGIRYEEAGGSVAREAQLYDPSSGVWTSAAVAQIPRPAHSSAVLLPDGRVMTAGSTDRSGHGELRVELYHPPYLFRGDRPVLEDAPSEITYGGFFSVKTADSDVRQLCLVKPMSVSHGLDAGQRLVDVPFESRGGCQLEAVAPENPNIAPPGLYLLFLINHKGTPSYGRWMLLAQPSRTHRIWTERHRESNIDAGSGVGGLGRHSWNGSDPRRDPVSLQTSDQLLAPKAAEGAIADAALDLYEDESLVEQAYEVQAWLPELADVSADDAPPQPVDFLLEEPLETRWLDEPANPVWVDQDAPGNQGFGMYGDAAVHWGPVIPWHRWGRPALIIGSAGLLAMSMVLDAAPLQAGAAFIFLLFAPGMALVGLHPPSGWASELALAVGLSLALETLLAVAGLYFGIWSAEGILLLLLLVSLSGATVQLIKAAFGQSGNWGDPEVLGEAPA